AIVQTSEAVKLDPRNAQAYIIRADARLTRLRPDGPGRARGTARPGKEALDEIILDYTEAIRLSPNLAEAHAKRGAASLEKGDIESAIINATKAIELDPRWVEAYCVRGKARLDKGEASAAAADFTTAMGLSPKIFQGTTEKRTHAAEAFYSRARLRASGGDQERAAADCRIALQLAPPRWNRRQETEALLQRATQGQEKR
ncbi:MAG: hypothetical protein ACRD1Z_19220, partial [Vicinamibacteria bacterium]